MGGCSKSQHSEHYFITHTHCDHSLHLPEAQKAFINIKSSPPNIFIPKEATKYVDNFMHSLQELNSVKDVDKEKNRTDKPFNLIGTIPGDSFDFGGRFKVKVVDCHHSVPTRGFCFFEVRKKLDEKYKSLSGKEISELRKKKCGSFSFGKCALICFFGRHKHQSF